jgi:replication factor C subunit 3/5
MRGRPRKPSPPQRPFISEKHFPKPAPAMDISNSIISTIPISSSIPWVEKYRPSHFQDIVLDPLNRELFQNILNKHYFPHLLFYGPPGTGKTTTIINLINEFQLRYYRVNKSTVIHLNASDERGIDIIRNQIHQFAKSKNLFESGLKFVILDEVDYMTKNAQQALKNIMQTSTYNVRFCLICNYITKMDESLKNEFLCIRFNQLPKTDIFKFIKNICEKEELNLTDETLETIQDMYQSDIRSMINFIQMEGTRVQSLYTPFHIFVLDNIHTKIRDKNTTLIDFNLFLNEISIRYNIDMRTLLQKYFNYLIRKGFEKGITTPCQTRPVAKLPPELVVKRLEAPYQTRPATSSPTELVVLGGRRPPCVDNNERNPTDHKPDKCKDISKVLDKIKIIIHRPDIPITILIEYLYLNFECFE